MMSGTKEGRCCMNQFEEYLGTRMTRIEEIYRIFINNNTCTSFLAGIFCFAKDYWLFMQQTSREV